MELAFLQEFQELALFIDFCGKRTKLKRHCVTIVELWNIE